MRTEKQIAASRANGAKSQGPATPEGKSISSRNALKSGLYAENNIIRGEDPAEFEALVESFHQSFRPVGADQEALVENLIRTKWLLTRLQNLETKLWERHIDSVEMSMDTDQPVPIAFGGSKDEFRLLQTRLDSTNRTYFRTRQTLLNLQKEQKAAPQPEESKSVTQVLGSFPHPAPEPPLPTAELPSPPAPAAQAAPIVEPDTILGPPHWLDGR